MERNAFTSLNHNNSKKRSPNKLRMADYFTDETTAPGTIYKDSLGTDLESTKMLEDGVISNLTANLVYAEGQSLKSCLIDQERTYNLIMQLKSLKDRSRAGSQSRRTNSQNDETQFRSNNVTREPGDEKRDWNFLMTVLRANPELLVKVIPQSGLEVEKRLVKNLNRTVTEAGSDDGKSAERGPRSVYSRNDGRTLAKKLQVLADSRGASVLLGRGA